MTARPTDGQQALPGLGPKAGDSFRFTWHNTQIGARVWVHHNGSWRAGIVDALGRKRVTVAIETTRRKRLLVSKPYTELRRRTDSTR